jgi:hypothetical protein
MSPDSPTKAKIKKGCTSWSLLKRHLKFKASATNLSPTSTSTPVGSTDVYLGELPEDPFAADWGVAVLRHGFWVEHTVRRTMSTCALRESRTSTMSALPPVGSYVGKVKIVRYPKNGIWDFPKDRHDDAEDRQVVKGPEGSGVNGDKEGFHEDCINEEDDVNSTVCGSDPGILSPCSSVVSFHTAFEDPVLSPCTSRAPSPDFEGTLGLTFEQRKDIFRQSMLFPIFPRPPSTTTTSQNPVLAIEKDLPAPPPPPRPFFGHPNLTLKARLIRMVGTRKEKKFNHRISQLLEQGALDAAGMACTKRSCECLLFCLNIRGSSMPYFMNSHGKACFKIIPSFIHQFRLRF